MTCEEKGKRMRRCCFTGHRPEKLHCSEAFIRSELMKQTIAAIEDGKRTFISGMSRGVDIWAAEAVLSLRKELPTLRLIAAVPYPSFEQRWSHEWQHRYYDVLAQSDLIKYICPQFSLSSYQQRNIWMVDHSSLLIAVFNGSAGGTKNTLDYARSQNVRTVLISSNRR